MIDSLTGLIAGKNAETTAMTTFFRRDVCCIKKVITWHPDLYAWYNNYYCTFLRKGDLTIVFAHIFGGATMLVAFFSATDYSTSPTTPKGEIIWNLLWHTTNGLRSFSSMAEEYTFVLLIMNCFVPLIDYTHYSTSLRYEKRSHFQ